ncbi:class F sortase [Planococcus sp. N028]|uniref:Class F sortase n=1 Tax=Planococcus shixiaomingii TaxID=3058393 RepID=A0ABT8N2N4_9BACL|nr:class F sortase [Planococcus sp. N028]MDN7242145.1 class F sortase [Planococcus sp. N028]
MRQLLTMGSALCLCAALFFFMKPLANDSIPKESSAQVNEQKETAKTDSETKAAGNNADKIAEFPILPAQREKLETMQRQRQESIKGMVPAQIEIPSIGVKASVEQTGILENGEMGVPEDVNEVGWFEPGYKTGEKGHAVLAGHVDSLTGPAIFYNLEKVKAGEKVTIKDADGREMVFEVKEISSYETDEAPIEEIFGKSEQRMINLITCTGDFNRKIGSHEERLVVSAELISDSDVEEKAPEPPTNVKATSFNISWHAVRDDAIIGYRVYEEDLETKEIVKIATVSLFDRKKVELQTSANKRYFVTSVDVDLDESKKAEAKQ